MIGQITNAHITRELIEVGYEDHVWKYVVYLDGGNAGRVERKRFRDAWREATCADEIILCQDVLQHLSRLGA